MPPLLGKNFKSPSSAASNPRTPSHVHPMYWLVFFLARRKNNDAASTGQPEGREAGGSVKLRFANWWMERVLKMLLLVCPSFIPVGLS